MKEKTEDYEREFTMDEFQLKMESEQKQNRETGITIVTIILIVCITIIICVKF